MGGCGMMQIRDYKTGDEKAILKLFQITFNKSMSLEYWNWRFRDNPLKKILIKLMWDGDELVGHYAVSPVLLNLKGKSLLTALSMTTMTHPEYGGQGIFTQLAGSLYEQAISEGFAAIWGFPNNNSHYGFVKNLQWCDLEKIPLLSIDTSKIKTTSTSQISICENLTAEHEQAQKSLLNADTIATEKSITYLNWRYRNNPSNQYDLFEMQSGSVKYYVITKLYESFLQSNQYEVDILECAFPADEIALLQMLNAVKTYYASSDPLRINLWLSVRDEKHILFEKIGFQNQLPVTYSGIRILDKLELNETDFINWNYTMGDSDVF